MAANYTPLFNRTYLTALVWISAVVILYLATLSEQEPDYLRLEQADAKPVYWTTYESDIQTLTLLLPTGSALTRAEQLQQSLLLNVLENQLQGWAPPANVTLQTQAAADHLAIDLSWPSGQPAPQWQSLLTQLSAPLPETDWRPLADKLAARAYLASHQADAKLLNAYFEQIAGGGDEDPLSNLERRYRQMISNIRFLISGDDSEALAGQLAQHLPDSATAVSTQRTLNTTPTVRKLPYSSDNRYHLLVGSIVPPRSDAQFAYHRLIAHSVQRALDSRADALKLEYRLRWAALQDGGYQALLLHADTPLNQNTLSGIANQLTPEHIEASRSELLQQWQLQMSEQPRQLSALRTVALYGLPLDTLQTYPEAIAALSATEVSTDAQAGLQAERQIIIQLTQNYE